MFWLITSVQIIVVAEASILQDVGSLFGYLVGMSDCKVSPIANDTFNTSCGTRPTSCSDSYYRTVDGLCNNLNYGWWGIPYTPYARLLNNNYYDGVHVFPKSKSKKDFKNPRSISLKLYSSENSKDDIIWNLGFMQYGQIIAHDMALTAGVGQTGVFVACCSRGQLTEVSKTDPRCAAIPLPKDDPYNGPAGRICMNFYRTETTKDRNDCVGTTKVAEPLNRVSSFLDVGYLYGNDEETADAVREKQGGRLKSVKRNGREYLAQDPNPTDACIVPNNATPCFRAGDIRVNQNPQLALLHNIYMIHHNKIADELSRLNPHWDDEKTFQETRKIVIAVHQNVIYYEYLPYVLGATVLINQNIIYPGAKDFINDYNPNVHPGVSNEFSMGAFRLYHSFIKGLIKIYNKQRNVADKLFLRDTMLCPYVIEQNDNFLGLTISLYKQPMDAYDTIYANDILNFMFMDGDLGDDLKTMDIMRARDHGMSSYSAAIVKCCLGKKPETFKDLEKYIDEKYIALLAEIYESPDDVELHVGITLERRLPATVCGSVSCCIIAEQFYRTRVGDRYFYENNQHKSSFKIDQLNSIRQTSSFAMLLCQVPGITHVQRRAFENPSLINILQPCISLPKLNLSLWKEANATQM